MCGFAGTIAATGKTIPGFADALHVGCVNGESRGKHSTGILQVEDKRAFVYKKPLRGKLFAELPVVRQYVADAEQAGLTMIHHRFATTGAVNEKNAHPFVIRENASGGKPVIIGAHNGIISSWKEDEDGRKFEVDSEWALYRVMKLGDAAFKDFQGYFVLIYYDFRNNTINFVSDGGRALHLARSPDGIMFASERSALVDMTKKVPGVDYTIDPLPQGERVTFDATTLVESRVKVTLRQAPVASSYQGGTSHHGGTYGGGESNRYRSSTTGHHDLDNLRPLDSFAGSRTPRPQGTTPSQPALPQVYVSEIDDAKKMGLSQKGVRILTINFSKPGVYAHGLCRVLSGDWKDEVLEYRIRFKLNEFYANFKADAVKWQATEKELEVENRFGTIRGVMQDWPKKGRDTLVLGVPWEVDRSGATPANRGSAEQVGGSVAIVANGNRLN